MMKRCPIILFVLLSICLTTKAQNNRGAGTRKLSVESLVLDVSDISGSVHMRLDANNSPCALIKIHLWDKIKYVEGQIVGEIIDKGSEKWIYVTEGTKKIKIIPSSYLPFEISVKDVSSIISFQGKKTYVLKLRGESFPNNNKAVKKASDKDPLIPQWVSIVDSSEWLGVSAPCHSPERARIHAICNALTNYVISKGRGELVSKTNSSISTKEESTNFEILLAQDIILEGMSFEITREYYNYRGEYFVLCAVVEDNRYKDNNVKLTRHISFAENSISGDIADTWSVSFSVLFQMDEERGDIVFSCENNNMALDIDGKPIASSQKFLYPETFFKSSVYKNSLVIEDSGDMNMFSLGIIQSLLYAHAPFAPSIGKASLGRFKSRNENYMNGFGGVFTEMEYHYKGSLLPLPLKFEFILDKTLHFSVKENIFDNSSTFNDSNILKYVRKEAKASGLSEDYYVFLHKLDNDSLGVFADGCIVGNVPILLGKNIAFWICWEDWISKLSVNVQYEEGTSISRTITELNNESAISENKWNVKPFWFMDSNKIDFNHKNASTFNKFVRVAFLKNEK